VLYLAVHKSKYLRGIYKHAAYKKQSISGIAKPAHDICLVHSVYYQGVSWCFISPCTNQNICAEYTNMPLMEGSLYAALLSMHTTSVWCTAYVIEEVDGRSHCAQTEICLCSIHKHAAYSGQFICRIITAKSKTVDRC
jgi:hypothetical protein